MDLKKQTIIVLIFLSTGFFNKITANTITLDSNKNEVKESFLKDEIKQFAEDSIKISIDGKKAFLFGNAKIEYQKTKISASFIEINWSENTLIAKYTIDSNGNKIGKPVFSEGNDEFIAEEIRYNLKLRNLMLKIL